MKQLTSNLMHLLCGIALIIVTSPLFGQGNTPVATPAAKSAVAVKPAGKPAWLTDLSVGVKESYDNNVLLVSGDGVMNEQFSWVTTVSPKVGISLVPLLGSQKVVQTLSFGYAPDFASYHNTDGENNNAHRINIAIKGKSDAFSFNVDNAFVYVDGSKVAPVYPTPDNGRSAYATSAPRERRNQFQDRAKVVLQYDWEKIFVRPTASLLYYELLTYQSTASGYQNYADRYDINGGLDFGYKVVPQLSLVLGYRNGHQFQEKIISSPVTNSSSSYHRVLVGVEGKPVKWLTLAVLAGPDFRTYDEFAPVNDHKPVKAYGEASLTADVSANDSIVFKYKAQQWVSSTGQIPYFESSYDLSYRHKFGTKLVFDLGARLGTSDYTKGSLTHGSSPTAPGPAMRNDWMYTISTGLAYAVNANFTINATFAADFGRNQLDNLGNDATWGPRDQYREFDRYLTSLGGVVKF